MFHPNKPYCSMSRKGSNKTAEAWMRRVGVYVAEWDNATTRVWNSNAPFDFNEYNEYLQWYVTATRVRIVHHTHPEAMPGPATWDSYPSQSMAGSRQYAVCALFDLVIFNAQIYYTNF